MRASRVTSRHPTPPIWPSAGPIAALLVFLFVEILWIQAFPLGHHHTGDTNNLVVGARTALDCLGDGTWRDCAHDPGSTGSGVFPYPLLQYLPAMLAIGLGASDAAALGFLARLSVLAFAACLGLTWFTMRRQPRLAALGVLAVLGSAATYQATSSFGEMLAAAAVLSAVVAVRGGRTVPILTATFIACIAKETLAPFVVLLGLVAGRPEERWLPPRRVLLSLAAGSALGILANVAFNLFRYGSPRNLNYLQSFRRTPGLGLKAELFAGEWLSPVAGLAWTWPILTLLVLAASGGGLQRLAASPRRPLDWVPPLLAAGIVLLFTASLANWFSPFGWAAYGHRLAVPVLPAAVVALLVTIRQPLVRTLGRLSLRPAAAAAAVALLAVTAWSQMAAPWTWRDSLSESRAEDPGCAEAPIIELEPDRYYHCLTDTMWPADLSTRRAARPDASVPLAARAVALGAAAGLSLWVVRPASADRSHDVAGTNR